MSREIGIEILAKLNSKKSEKAIQDQLKDIQSKLNLQIGIDTKAFDKIGKQVQSLQNQIKQQSKNIKIIDDQEALKGINKSNQGVRELYSSIDQAVKRYKQFGEVKVSKNLDPITKDIKSFNLEVKKGNGITEKLRLNLAKINAGDGFQEIFEVDSRKILDATERVSNKLQSDEVKQRKLIEETNDKLEHRLDLYKQNAQIKAQDLRRRYRDHIDESSLNSFLGSVNSLKSDTPDVAKKMDMLDMKFKQISSTVRTSSARVLGFGEAMETALVKFCRLV